MEQTFGARLYRLRKERGISQEELADVIGVSRQAVQKWEAGTSRPDMDNLAALGEYFGVSLDALILGREEREAAPSRARLGAWEETEHGMCRSEDGEKPWHWHYEYRSRSEWNGVPLVHVNLGKGRNYRAKGVVALGNSAVGLVALGYTSLGLVSAGLCTVGVLSLGCLSVGLLAALGAVAVGSFAAGGAAVGYMAAGGVAVGVYAMGGLAVGMNIAAGGFAVGHIAIGDVTRGEIAFHVGEEMCFLDQSGAILEAIHREFPKLPGWLAKLFAALG